MGCSLWPSRFRCWQRWSRGNALQTSSPTVALIDLFLGNIKRFEVTNSRGDTEPPGRSLPFQSPRPRGHRTAGEFSIARPDVAEQFESANR
jgi:hypothetical protein